MTKKLTLIKISIILGYIGIPATAIALFFFSSQNIVQFLFLIFILFHAIERVWETFFTSNERKAFELHGDWTLAAVTIAYLVLGFLFILEFFLCAHFHDVGVTILGLFLYLVAFRLRWWGMSSLGKQWAIHAVGAQKIRKIRLIKIGAYKYIRHPIYLAIMLEVLSLPLIANTFFSLLFAILINIPLQYLRLFVEEKSSLRRFGERYIQYEKETNALIPLKYFKKKIFKEMNRIN